MKVISYMREHVVWITLDGGSQKNATKIVKVIRRVFVKVKHF